MKADKNIYSKREGVYVIFIAVTIDKFVACTDNMAMQKILSKLRKITDQGPWEMYYRFLAGQYTK